MSRASQQAAAMARCACGARGQQQLDLGALPRLPLLHSLPLLSWRVPVLASVACVLTRPAGS